MPYIKPATADDADLIRHLGRETFYETFSAFNSEETMQQYLAGHFSAERLKEELSNVNSLFFITCMDDLPVAYLKLNTGTAQTEAHDPDALEIERIYVKADYQGLKIGQLLLDKAIEVASAQNKKTVWLGVWEKNIKAIQFYEKNGFAVFDEHLFQMGNEAQRDLMMRKILH